MPQPAFAPRRLLGLTLLLVVALVSACGVPKAGAASGRPASSHHAVSATHHAVSAARCAANRAAGTLTYLTGFGYAGSVGILDVIAAEARGDFAAVCLRVKIVPGSNSSMQLVASGRATVANEGSPSNVLEGVVNGHDHVVAVATYGNVTAYTLMTMRNITNLKQLDGKTIGYKGEMPPEISAMLAKAGVKLSSVKEVSVGDDPTILPRGQVQALTGYRSNEPFQLRGDGYKIREWNPGSFGIKSAFNVQVFNPAFARAHPDAVEDFLRASFHAYAFCAVHADTCLSYAARLNGAGYDLRANAQEWRTETQMVAASMLPGKGLGAETMAQWQAVVSLELRYHLLDGRPDLARIVAPSYVNAIERGRRLIWPGP